MLHQAHIGEYLRMDFYGKIYYEWEFWILGVFNQVILVIYTCLCKKLSINMRFRFRLKTILPCDSIASFC